MSTFYNRKNMNRYERYALESTMSYAEFVHNDQQRPAIMRDMEHALIGMFNKAINNGVPMGKRKLKYTAKDIFNKL